jgi:hypothetical protein
MLFSFGAKSPGGPSCHLRVSIRGDPWDILGGP